MFGAEHLNGCEWWIIPLIEEYEEKKAITSPG